MALRSTVLPAFLLARGIALIGSGPASIVSTVGPVSTILLAYLFLQEPLSLTELAEPLRRLRRDAGRDQPRPCAETVAADASPCRPRQTKLRTACLLGG